MEGPDDTKCSYPFPHVLPVFKGRSDLALRPEPDLRPGKMPNIWPDPDLWQVSKDARYLTEALVSTGALAKRPEICPKCKHICPKREELLLKLPHICPKMAEYLAISRTSGSYRMFGQSRISAFFGCRRFGRIIGRIVGRTFCRRKIRLNTAIRPDPLAKCIAFPYICILSYSVQIH